MFQLENNVVEVGEVFKEIMENPEKCLRCFNLTCVRSVKRR